MDRTSFYGPFQCIPEFQQLFLTFCHFFRKQEGSKIFPGEGAHVQIKSPSHVIDETDTFLRIWDFKHHCPLPISCNGTKLKSHKVSFARNIPRYGDQNCEQWQKNHHILVSHRQVRTPANIWISHNSQTPPKSGPHLVAHTFDWSRTRSWPSWLHQAIHRLLPHSFLFKRQVILVIWFQQIEAQSPQDFGLLPAPSESNSPSNPTRKISRGHTHCEKRSPPRRALTRRPKQEMHSSFASLPLHSCHRKGSPISHLGGVFPSRFSNSIWCAHRVTRDDMVEVDPSLFVYDDNSFDPISDPTKLRIIMVFEIVGTFTCSRQGKDGEAFGKNRITDLVF